MTKEELMALKPYPKTKINSQWQPPTVSVEAKRVVITHHDKLKREMDMAPFICNYEVVDTEEVGMKKVRKL